MNLLKVAAKQANSPITLNKPYESNTSFVIRNHELSNPTQHKYCLNVSSANLEQGFVQKVWLTSWLCQSTYTANIIQSQ